MGRVHLYRWEDTPECQRAEKQTITKKKKKEAVRASSDVKMGNETNEEISESQSERMALTPSTGGINNSLGRHKKHIKT